MRLKKGEEKKRDKLISKRKKLLIKKATQAEKKEWSNIIILKQFLFNNF